MGAPQIHGKGRILFSYFEIGYVEIDNLLEIPGGPPKNEEFIQEGVDILLAYPMYDFPYIIAVRDDEFPQIHWIIEGRHRRASYHLAGVDEVVILRGIGMKVLDSV